jgi:hypothetical protein
MLQLSGAGRRAAIRCAAAPRAALCPAACLRAGGGAAAAPFSSSSATLSHGAAASTFTGADDDVKDVVIVGAGIVGAALAARLGAFLQSARAGGARLLDGCGLQARG